MSRHIRTPDDAARRIRMLRECLRKKGPLLVAYSGGVDSGLLAAVAAGEPGSRARAATLDAPIFSRRAIRDAASAAKQYGIPHDIIPFPVMEDEAFRKNQIDRCYLCKKAASRLLREHAAGAGCAAVADGANISDLDEYRPGLRASDEEGICHPFIEAGMAKSDVRRAAEACGLPFWNKPSSACLASRIPYGEEITEEKLRMIEDAEEFLFGKGFSQVRVRMHGPLARIEVLPGEIEKAVRLRDEIAGAFLGYGFVYVTLDLAGFRSGSMDEVL
ncbi:MAG: ATP-dependent sacrificial sulfur transferase LarE [Methanomicrobiaceae archaeon]|uniref:Atp-utilizing enzyme of the pp-loop superfamily n=1 Tax=hydrocarbon metagenome TaxID=938273 RepID=A0A0W8FI63_9ZZZZ|nr:ATP-dependent sacrificial sulfur transferase LarE [Methanomicrobiaceae archaeon]MDD5418281.1 ATP-dependent sacrificial sulfur transferase LarE [Methanomicrobiaceae archaeon]